METLPPPEIRRDSTPSIGYDQSETPPLGLRDDPTPTLGIDDTTN